MESDNWDRYFDEEGKRKLLELWDQVVGTQPNYLYWSDKKGNQYFHTTEKVNHNGKPRYASGIYRYFKKGNVYKARNLSYHATKWRAVERAYKMVCKADGDTYTPYTVAGQRREKKRLEKELGKIHDL
jgi:hypothetical protein